MRWKQKRGLNHSDDKNHDSWFMNYYVRFLSESFSLQCAVHAEVVTNSEWLWRTFILNSCSYSKCMRLRLEMTHFNILSIFVIFKRVRIISRISGIGITLSSFIFVFIQVFKNLSGAKRAWRIIWLWCKNPSRWTRSDEANRNTHELNWYK